MHWVNSIAMGYIHDPAYIGQPYPTLIIPMLQKSATVAIMHYTTVECRPGSGYLATGFQMLKEYPRKRNLDGKSN